MLKKAFWLFGFAVFLLVIFLPGYTKLQELREKNVSLETKIKRLYVENALLEQELKQAESDAVYQEKAAREKMGIVRKGEVPVKIITSDLKR
jgi:cell division protein FtsB